MKKIVAVLGSPREESISTELAEAVIRGAQESSNITIEYDISKMYFSGCAACGECRNGDTYCVIEDDFQDYLEDLKTADILILSSPNYYSHIAGPMVTFMNRHYCLLDKDRNPRLKPGKKVFGIFSQGAPAPNDEYEKAYSWYLGIFEKFGFENLGHITAGGNSDIKKMLKEAEEIGKNL